MDEKRKQVTLKEERKEEEEREKIEETKISKDLKGRDWMDIYYIVHKFCSYSRQLRMQESEYAGKGKCRKVKMQESENTGK
jgi:hypothetical protein